jgi:putative heme-binding domain-containing protein
MPATSLSQSESSHIVAYLRSEARPTRAENNGGAVAERPASPKVPGDSVRGKLLFEKHGCLNCHRVGTEGSYSGPAFSDTSFARTPEELRQSILDPDAEILPPNRSYRVVTSDGATIIGRLLNHDTFRVQLVDAKGNLLSLAKANLREQGFLRRSPMPSYRDKLTPEELVDLVAYVATANQK